MEIVDSLREQLRIHEQNLTKLERQAARYGMDVPLRLQNQIDFERQKIEELKMRLAEAEADRITAGVRVTPAPPTVSQPPSVEVEVESLERNGPWTVRVRVWWRSLSPAQRVVIIVALIGLLGALGATVAGKLAATPTPSPNGILLDDFEDGIDGWYAARAGTNEWGPAEVAIVVHHSSDAAVGSGALQCDFDFNLTDEFDPRATCFFVELPVQDWTKYNALQLRAKSLVDAHYNLRVFIALATGDKSCWNELDDFQPLGSEYQTLTFNLDRALYKTCQSYEDYNQVLLGKDQVFRLHLIFTAEHKPSGAVLVDEIWLLKP